MHDYDESDAYPSDDFNEALSVFNEKESVEFTCICGDITQDGTEEELQKYQADVAAYSPDTPVYTTTGNHDCVQGATSIDTSLWQTYTGQELCFEFSKTLNNGNIDHFLFFGMESWDLGDIGTPYNDASISWLEEKLEAYKNDRCFVFTHLFFPERAGNLGMIYPYYNWLGGTQLVQIQELNDRYINSVWFSGHSHWKWYLQKYEDTANVYRSYNSDGSPSSGWCVHVPSCASPIDSDYSETGTVSSVVSSSTARVSKPLESEGAIVDVYEDYIDIRGISFKGSDDTDYTNKYLPIATYRLNTEIIEISDSNVSDTTTETMDASGFSMNNYVYTNNTDEYPLVEYDELTDTVKITFSTSSQKLIYESSLLTSDVADTDIKIECDSIKYTSDGAEVELSDSDKQGLGFYKNDGYYTVASEYGELLYPSTFDGLGTYYCLQFNSSGSKYAGSYPITIEMTGMRLVVKSQSQNSDDALMLSADKFYLSGSNEGSPVVEDDGEYLVINFDQVRNRLMFTTDEFIATTTTITLYHDGIKYSEEIPDTEIENIGFQTYNDSYGTTSYSFESGSELYYATDDTGSENAGAYCIQCNVSSSYAGTLPMTVRIKNPYVICS